MSGLPRGWTSCPLLDAVEVHDSRRIPLNASERAKRQGPFPYYGANGLVDHVDSYLFDGDFVLLAEDGGNFDKPERGVAYEVSGQFWVNNHAHILKPRGEMPVRFLRYWLNAIDWMPYVGGTTRAKLTQGGMSQVNIPLPPVEDQRCIVAKLDSFTASTTRAKDELGRIPRLITEYRAAILTAAFKGELTREWRAQRIRPRAKLPSYLGITDEHGAVQGNWRLPEGWSWVSAGALCEIKGGITLGKKYPSTTTLVSRPYLRVANVQRGWLKLDEIKTIRVTEREAQALALKAGDILMNEGGDRDKLGRGWIWENQIPDCIHQNHVFRLRLRTPLVPPRYISLYANEFGQQYFFDEGKQTTNLASISMRKIAALPIPVPSADEMQEIIHRIETAFAWLDRVIAEHANASRLLPKLDQAILGKAFRGELVTHD